MPRRKTTAYASRLSRRSLRLPNQYIVAANNEIDIAVENVSRGQTNVKVELINDYPK